MKSFRSMIRKEYKKRKYSRVLKCTSNYKESALYEFVIN